MANKINYTGSSKILKRLCELVNYLIDNTVSNVEITPSLSSGTKIADYEIGDDSGELYAPSVSVTPSLSSGTKIADFDVGDGPVEIYAPSPVTDAEHITYDNSISELSADNVQAAIDEIAEDFQDGCDIIVSAVTAKGQTPASNSPADIADAIGNISTAVLGETTVISNGVYLASDDNLDGYSKVTVNVSSGGVVGYHKQILIHAVSGKIHVSGVAYD